MALSVNNILGAAGNAGNPLSPAAEKSRTTDGFAAIFAALFAVAQPVPQNAVASPIDSKAGPDMPALSSSTTNPEEIAIRLADASGPNTGVYGWNANPPPAPVSDAMPTALTLGPALTSEFVTPQTQPSMSMSVTDAGASPVRRKLAFPAALQGSSTAIPVASRSFVTRQWAASNSPNASQVGAANGLRIADDVAGPMFLFSAAGDENGQSNSSVMLNSSAPNASAWNQKSIVVQAGGFSFPIRIGLAQLPPAPAMPWTAGSMSLSAVGQTSDSAVTENETAAEALPSRDAPFNVTVDSKSSAFISLDTAEAARRENSVAFLQTQGARTAEPQLQPVPAPAATNPLPMADRPAIATSIRSAVASSKNPSPLNAIASSLQSQVQQTRPFASGSRTNEKPGSPAAGKPTVQSPVSTRGLDMAPQKTSKPLIEQSPTDDADYVSAQSPTARPETDSHNADRAVQQSPSNKDSGQRGPSDAPAAAQPAQASTPASQQAAPASNVVASHTADASPAAATNQAIAAANGTIPHQTQAPTPSSPSVSSSTADLTPLSVNAAQFAAHVIAKVKDGDRQFDIRLDPPDLGRVDVHLSVTSTGQAQAHVMADKPQTLDALQRDQQTLHRALKDAGLDLGSNALNFSLKGHDRGDGGAARYAPSVRASVETDIHDAPRNLPFISSRAADGRLDIRV